MKTLEKKVLSKIKQEIKNERLEDWFNGKLIVQDDKYNKVKFVIGHRDARMAKYWAAKEIAKNIIAEYKELIDEDLYLFAEYIKTQHRNFLSQLLKKEWFR